MGKLTKMAVRNSFAVILIIILLLGGGIYSAKNMQMETMPNISIPMITISTLYPGGTPEEVDSDISLPLQKALSGIQGVTDIKTISNQNISFVVMEFDYSANLDDAEKQVQDAVNKFTLPSGAEQPDVNRVSFGSFPAMTYTVQSSMSSDQLNQFINVKLQPKVSGVSGVSNVAIEGSSVKQISIRVNNDELSNNNLTLQDVQKALTANNVTIPAGQFNQGQQTLTVSIDNKLQSISDLQAIPLIVLPNATQSIGDAMNQITQGMQNLAGSVGQISGAVGDLGKSVGGMGQDLGQLGSLVGGNVQAMAMLNVIQKAEAAIISQQQVLANPGSTPVAKKQAQAAIQKAQATLQGAQSELDTLLADQAAKGKALAGTKPQVQAPVGEAKKPGPMSAVKAPSTVSPSIKVVFLKDVATVSESNAPVDLYTRSSGKPGVVLNIYKTDNANTVILSQNVSSALADLAQSNSQVTFTKINDSADAVKTSVNGMLREGLLGALFAIIVIALFLRDVRATVIAVISIPLSILITLIFLPRFAFTLNTMTLGGIAVAIGRIVDDSIVVIENIYRHKQQGLAPGREMVENAAGEVARAITSSTITTVAVFLPLGMVTGIVGKLFVPFAYTIVISILASLLVALTVVPALARLMILRRPVKHQAKASKFTSGYGNILKSALNHKFIVLLGAVIILLGSFVLLKQVGIQFLPSDTTSVLQGSLTMPPGTSLSQTNAKAEQFEQYLDSNPNVKTVVSVIGNNTATNKTPGAMQQDNQGSFTIVLKDGINKDPAAQAIIAKAKQLQTGGEALVVKTQSSTGQKDNFELTVNGNNMDDITKATSIIMQTLAKDQSLENLANNLAQKKPEISIKIDAGKAAQNGLTPIAAAGLMRNILSNNYVMTLTQGTQNTDVMLGFAGNDINSVSALENIQVNGANGPVQLKDISTIQQVNGAVSISELDGNQYADITADINGNDTQKVANDALKLVDGIKEQLPKGVTYSLTGTTSDIASGFGQMGLAMLAAVLLVYIVMVMAFGEGLTPLAILFSLPFAATGALIALYLTAQPLTMSGLIGMLMLIGIVVTNAIVLLDRVKSNRKQGMALQEALIEAGSVRLRPIVMTALATIMATLPLALGFSEGTIMSQGMGIVVIGGLTLSTILTLVIVPIIFSLLETAKEKLFPQPH
ncbi:swarming motility protein SwrC [Desulfosporosinus acididurans]|uniref:Swarming motility protein SwrC n=1 Tax=Desulfosporosinus acididurans TaxID=476652 RepID=A0A0J1IJF7_9FIRM|nr:efflux RND transporter permease subunit [Desulfosporosinus acididurans]KLU64866.1 swarming motility protein SwrC [Desulfosporosinus acididurans]